LLRAQSVIRWAWRSSALIDTDWKMRAKFVCAALQEPALSRSLEQLDPDTPLARFLAEHPQTIGNLVWPYQCAAWDAPTRFARITAHLDALEHTPSLKIVGDEKIVFADLTAISDDACVILDYSPWLAREGHLTLSLFKGHLRAFTVAFSLYHDSETEIFIGGIQGRKNDQDMLALYREMTKDFHGVRPRDFMLEMVRLFAIKHGVQHIYAVADDQRISRHPYFAKKDSPGLTYDDVWTERGGTRVAPTHFELPLLGTRRDLDEVATKKRKMYRQRYEMFDAIEERLPNDLKTAERRHFDAS
jgi:uncharacterized protein VirK/YbjX